MLDVTTCTFRIEDHCQQVITGILKNKEEEGRSKGIDV